MNSPTTNETADDLRRLNGIFGDEKDRAILVKEIVDGADAEDRADALSHALAFALYELRNSKPDAETAIREIQAFLLLLFERSAFCDLAFSLFIQSQSLPPGSLFEKFLRFKEKSFGEGESEATDEE